MSGGAALFVEHLGVDAELVKRLVEQVDVEALGLELEFETFEDRKAGVTAIVVEHSELDPAFESLGAELARSLKRPVWVLSTVVLADWWLAVTAFDKQGDEKWHQEPREPVDAKVLSAMLRKFGTPKLTLEADELPYWRMVSEWKSRPRKPLVELGLSPVLQLGDVKGWCRVSTLPRRFSEKKRAELAAAAKKAAGDQAAREAQALVAARQVHAEREAARRAEADAEAKRLMPRELVPGETRNVELPAAMQRTVDALVKKYAVSAAWVWQAAVAHSTPWRFPSSALAAVPLVKPVAVELIVSPALASALEKSSLTHPDGTPASFDELVRIAASLGLDGLAEELRDDEKKRKKLARK